MIIDSPAKLKKIIDRAREDNKSVLIKKGVFDIIHPGHLYSIKEYKKAADIIIILVQSDELTHKKKGPQRPINNQRQRMLVMDGIKGVDYVFPDQSLSRNDYIKFLNYLKPDILAVTSIDKEKTRAYSSPYWQLQEFPDKNDPGFSTSNIIQTIVDRYK